MDVIIAVSNAILSYSSKVSGKKIQAFQTHLASGLEELDLWLLKRATHPFLGKGFGLQLSTLTVNQEERSGVVPRESQNIPKNGLFKLKLLSPYVTVMATKS